MKNKLFFVLAIVFIATHTYAQRLTTKVVSATVSPKSIPQLLTSAERQVGKDLFLQLVADGRWNVLKNHFRNAADFEKLLAEISYYPREARTTNNPSIYANLKPYILKSSNDSKLVLQNSRDKSTLQINYTLTILPQDFIIENISIQSSASNARLSAGRDTDTVPTFARLATYERKEYKKPKYYENISNYFLDFKSTPYADDAAIPFQQINFADFVVQLDYCYNVPLLGKQCGRRPYNYQLGPVLSGKDDPDYDPELNPIFENVADITAFANTMTDASGNILSYLRNKNVITCVIADDKGQKITFYREGLEPIDYGLEDGEQPFDNPIAVKEINNVIYVLDIGFSNHPKIYMFTFAHYPDGNYQINNLGKLDLGGITLNYPSDIGGYKGRELSDNHVLLICDLNGIHSLELNPTSGQTAMPIAIQTYTELYDENNPVRSYDLKEIKKLDADKNSGYTIALSYQNDIFSFANQQTYRRTGKIAATNHARTQISDLSNLAYMQTEQKWYVTDLVGGLHTLDQYGRYLGGNTNPGKGEYGGELYQPNAITPNPIEDPTDPFRYRFIIANKWTRETGFKLFSPMYVITDLSVFENLQDNDLTFTFSTSGKWEAVENVTAKAFDGLYINGTKISQTQIGADHQLNDFPNKITINPNAAVLKPYLNRGWNKISVVINLTKSGSKIPVKQDSYFYWLPQDFVSSGDVFDDANLDENRYTTMAKQYIYKNINIADGQIMVSKKDLIISEYGSLTFLKGGSFYNESKYTQGLGNIDFENNNGRMIFQDSSFICINNASNTNANPFYTLPDLKDNFLLSAKHIKGINSSLYALENFPASIVSNCKTACEFLIANKIAVTFNEEIIKTNNPYKVSLNLSGTTYSNYIKTTIQKIDQNDYIISTAELVLKRQATDVYHISDSLGSTLIFEPCNKYKIKLTIGCNAEATNTVTWLNDKIFEKLINTAPKVDAGMDDNVCTDLSSYTMANFSPTLISPNSTGIGVWTGEGITAAGVVNFSTLDLSLLPKTISYTYTFAEDGCTVSDNKILKVYPIPTAPVLSHQNPVCKNGPLKFIMQNTPGPKVWYRPDGKVFSTIQNPVIENIQESGQYRATVTLDGCTSPETTIDVIVNPLPIVTAGNDTLVCEMSSSIWLTTGMPRGGGAYWSGKSVGNYIFSPVSAGFGVHPLTYVYTDTNGCRNSAVRNITVGPVLTAINESVCANSAAYMLGGVTPKGGTWSGNAVSSTGLFTPANSTIGTQYLTYTATINGCSNSIQKQVTVKPIPATPYLMIQPSEQACEGATVTLAVSTIIQGNTYKITGPNGFVADHAKASVYNITNAQQGLYTVITTQNGCTNVANANATKNLFVNPLPAVNAGLDEVTCTNSPNLILNTATPKGGSWSGVGIKKDTAIQTFEGGDNGAPPPPPIKTLQDVFSASGLPASSGYTLTYTYTNPATGCINSDTKEVMIGGNPTVTIESSNNDTTCSNVVIYTDLAAIAENSYNYSYQWYKNGGTIAGATSPVIRVTEPAKYKCVVMASCGEGFAEYEIKNKLEWTQLASHQRGTFGLTSDGKLWYWGYFSKTIVYSTPILIDSISTWKQISCYSYGYLSFGIKSDGSLWNLKTVLTSTNLNTQKIGTESDWEEISAGANHCLALKNDGTMWAWGSNVYGQCSGTVTSYEMPTKVGNDNDWKTVSAGYHFSLALKQDGTCWSWGHGLQGFPSYIYPTQFGVDADYNKIQAGFQVAYAIKNDKSLWSWGSNFNGMLGRVETSESSAVTDFKNWIDIKVGYYHAVALNDRGELWAWGNNRGIGDLRGDNGLLNYGFPVKSRLKDVKLISAGSDFTIATYNCSTILCGRGSNNISQLGIAEGEYYHNFNCIGTPPCSNPEANNWQYYEALICPGIEHDNMKSNRFSFDNSKFNSDQIQSLNLVDAIKLNPNPASHTVSILYGLGDFVGEAKILISDLLGSKPIKSIVIDSSKRQGVIEVALDNFVNGVYYVSIIKNENTVDTKKLIIIK